VGANLGTNTSHRGIPPTGDVGGEFNAWTEVTISLGTILICVAIAMPVVVIGALFAFLVWKLTKPTWLTIVVFSISFFLAFYVESGFVAWLWPWGLFIPGRLYHILPVVSALPYGLTVERSFGIELEAGPMFLIVYEAFMTVREWTPMAGIFRQARENGNPYRLPRWFQTYDDGVTPNDGGGSAPGSASTSGSSSAGSASGRFVDAGHPAGTIRLGVDRDNRRKGFDLGVAELGQHVFIPGASGSGKTTTLARIADGAMQSGYSVIIVDCKGSGLGVTAGKLAKRHGVPYLVVDPEDPDSLGYNPCTGDGADITNKLIGAFSYGTEGEIYKQVAMATLPVIVKALIAAKKPVTLASITDACDKNALAQLAYDAGAAQPSGTLQEELLKMSAAEGVGKAGYESLAYRFGALLQGKFGDLFKKAPALDWDAVLSRQSVVYIALSATAASEDVELMGRVVAQDLKQVCSRRLRAIQSGSAVVPAIVAFDEFAALREASQITDLLLQARQALMPVMLSTQYLPQDIPIRKAALSAGLLVVHRLEAQDAEDIAAQFGTRPRWKVTYQTDWEKGTTEKGSIRDVEEYVVHPNTLRQLKQGTAAVRSVPTQRVGIVEVMQVP